MKKSYITPAFTPVKMLMASASSACDFGVAHNGYLQCSVEIEGLGSIFSYGIPCDFDAGSGDFDGIFCFATQDTNATVFGS